MSEQKQQTLVEKLRNRRKEWASNPHYWMDSTLIIDVFNDVTDIVKRHSQETCNWRDNRGTALWECHYGGDYTGECGFEWNTPNKLSPSENEMNFCPKCGRKLVEAKPPSETQEKIYGQEMDKINFCGCGCILPDGLTRCSDCEVKYD